MASVFFFLHLHVFCKLVPFTWTPPPPVKIFHLSEPCFIITSSGQASDDAQTPTAPPTLYFLCVMYSLLLFNTQPWFMLLSY